MPDNEIDPDEYVDDDVKARLRAQGAAEFGQIVRRAIGNDAMEALSQKVTEGAADPLSAIEAKPVADRSRNDWGDLYGSGRCTWSQIPEAVREAMDMRA